MAQVTITLNGFNYIVGCEDGQESHLVAMAAQVEKRLNSVKALGNQSGEARLLMLAALLMADELHDIAIEMNSLRTAPRPNTRITQPTVPPAIDPDLLNRLEGIARRAEEIAAQMEQG